MLNFVKKNKFNVFIIFLAIIIIITSIYHSYKPLPEYVSYEGNEHMVSNVDLLYDLTYKKDNEVIHEQTIFKRIKEVIDEANDFIVIDMFLFNAYHDGEEDFPTISNDLMNTLLKKKKQKPDMDIVFITDEINTTYGSHEAKELMKLEKNGIRVVETNTNVLRDSNPIYSGLWRVLFQWFGQGGSGWIKNPMAENAPETTVRSYLKLLNIKANHRKVLVTEKSAIISSANPHDASGFHSNTAFEVSGRIIEEILQTEKAVLNFSGGGKLPTYESKIDDTGGNIAIQLLTEGKILKHVLKEIKESNENDEIWIGMFYIAERKIIEELEKASVRGVKVHLILDPNEHAFGQEKIGMPNRPVAAELIEEGQGNIEIKWYNTEGEQYHPKMIFFNRETVSVIIGGSANFTRRNLYDLNLETDIKIKANNEEDIIMEMESYYQRLWNNEDAEFTLPYEAYEDDTPAIKRIMYRIQKLLRLTTY